MTPSQARLVELDKRKDEYKKFIEDLQAVTAQVAAEIGVNGYFQDPEGTVYKVVEPDGKFVYFEKLSYNRTRRQGEKQGSLSMKEAKEAGFTLPE
jgi:hypothetical protein